jgi:hypothetical protein
MLLKDTFNRLSKLLLIRTRFVKKYAQAFKQAAGLMIPSAVFSRSTN